jgi:hypothetical protein
MYVVITNGKHGDNLKGDMYMSTVNAKIYYLLSTGESILITSEMTGDVIKTTKEQDILAYPQLKDKKIDEIDFIELEYGTAKGTLHNVKSCKVNIETKELEFIYYTGEELTEIFENNKSKRYLISRVSDLTQYLNNNEEVTSVVEDLIIQTEQNKILKSEGMM